MLRKLVKQGPTTLMVSMPSKWVKRHKLDKGDEVEIEEIGEGLTIGVPTATGKRETSLNLTQFTESATRTSIINAYRRGFDIIRITFNDEKQLKVISIIVKQHIIGFDVAQKTKTSCVLENITEPSEEQFDALVLKIFYNIDLLVQGTKERLAKGTKFDYADIASKIHQYDNFCRRVISKKNVHGNNAPLFWTFLGLLVHAQRELYHLNIYLEKQPIRVQQLSLFTHLETTVKLLQEAYIKKDRQLLEKLHGVEKQAQAELYEQLPTSGKKSIVLYHVATSGRKFYLAASPLMGLLTIDS